VSRSRARISRRGLFRLPNARQTSRTFGANDWPALKRVGGGDLLKARHPAMGSFFEVRLPARTPGGAALAQAMMNLIDALERQMTIYRDDSEIARLNATAHERPVPVEPGLFDLLSLGVRLHEQTGGAYDLASGALSLAWGFVKGPRRVPSNEERASARARSGTRHLVLDPEAQTVAFRVPGVVIDLGGIGKGGAVDRVARRIRSYWFPTSALIHGGASSLYAVGSPPDDFGGRWRIAVRHPFEPERPIGTVFLRNRGLATSGPAFRHFEANGRVYSHILDPRTGEPLGPEAPSSVTVLAPTAAEADALSTALSILGPEGSQAFLEARPDVAALFVDRDETGATRVQTFNCGEEDFSPEPLVPAGPPP